MFKKKEKINQVALPLTQCLAKTYKTAEGEKKAGREVLNHCHIVGEVARELRERLASQLADEFFPPGVELIAACHDIGKVSPTFQEKIYRGTEGYQKNSKPELKQANPDTEAAWGGHAGVSQAAAVELKLGKYIPDIIGQHHGFSPNHNHLATDEVFGGNAWQQRRKELVESLKHALETDFPQVHDALQARV
ncbi:MAG TPA: CRISPR-associated endonuclease Cas3'', partial [Pseudomonadales bacterium]|nr:CRISPR-associated endonuclease Cas3'' [Pseudomonadales bacterium]